MRERKYSMSRLKPYFTDKNAEVFLPDPLTLGKSLFHLFNDVSPVDVGKHLYAAGKDICHDVREYTREVRREQERFQQNLPALGIERVSRMRKRDVIDICSR